MTATDAGKVAEKLGAVKQLSPEKQAEIKRLRKKFYVPLASVATLHDWLGTRHLARESGIVEGDSGLGKTMGSMAYKLRVPVEPQSGKQRHMPVVYWEVTPNCGPKQFHKGLLEAMGNGALHGSTEELRVRSLDTLELRRTEMLILDEANRFKYETLAELSYIYNTEDLELSMILVGTHRLTTLITRDEQVDGRFGFRYHFDRMNQKEFEKTVAIWEEKVLRLPETSGLTSKESILLLAKATNYGLRALDTILRSAAIEAVIQDSPKITKTILQMAIANHKQVSKKRK
jgi:DNA transposition AAA+ family ATPase